MICLSGVLGCVGCRLARRLQVCNYFMVRPKPGSPSGTAVFLVVQMAVHSSHLFL